MRLLKRLVPARHRQVLAALLRRESGGADAETSLRFVVRLLTVARYLFIFGALAFVLLHAYQVWFEGDVLSVMEMAELWVVGFAGPLLAWLIIRVAEGLAEEAERRHQQVLLATAMVQGELDERKRIIERWRATSETLEALIRASPLPIVVVDIAGKVRMWNPAAERVFGWSQGEVQGQALPTTPQDAEEEARELQRRVMGGETLTGLELRQVRKDGISLQVSLSSALLRDAKGEVVGSVSLLEDITERKEAEENLRQRTRELEALASIANVLVLPGTFEERATRVLNVLSDLGGGEWITLRLPDREGKGLRLVAIAGDGPPQVMSVSLLSYTGSVGGLAFREGRLVVANDYLQHPQASQAHVSEGIRSMIAVPIRGGEGVMGVFSAASYEPNHFSPERVRLLAAIADGIGALLDNVRLQEQVTSELELGRRRLDAFGVAVGHLALEEDPAQALQHLVDTARELLDARYGALAVWDARDRLDRWVVSTPSSAEMRRLDPPPPHQGLPGLIRSQGEPVRSANLDLPSQRDGLPYELPDVKNFLGVPMVPREGTSGILFLLREKGAPEFTADDQRLLSVFSLLACVFLSNVDLYREVVQERRTLAAIQASMAEGLVVLDRRGRLLYANERAEQLIGQPVLQREGKTLLEGLQRLEPEDMGSPEGVRALVEAIQGARELPATIDLALLRPERRELEVKVFPILVDSDERMVGMLVNDVTEKRELERRRDTFISIASHELRTPMSSIIGFSELVLERDPPEGTRREWMGRIYREGRRLAAIVDDLLSVSGIQSGQRSFKPGPVAIGAVVEEALAAVRPTTKKHEFCVDLRDHLPTVLADRDRLREVLTDLLDNAVKYSPEGGPVTLSAWHEPDTGRVVVSVADTGIGIAPEDQGHLFSTFHRIQRPETTGIRGTGLGLYIVKSLVEMMGGGIWLESRVNEGTTFFFAVPTFEPSTARTREGALHDQEGAAG